MDTPSPLIEKFLPAELRRSMSEADITIENSFLDRASFHGALCLFFRLKEANQPFEGNASWLACDLAIFSVQNRRHFDQIHVCTSGNQVVMKPMSELIDEEIRAVGRKCCTKIIFPFAVQKPKDPDFVVSVAASFEHVYRRTRCLWSQSEPDCSLITRGVVLRELLAAWEKKDWSLCKHYAALALESFCLETFHMTYSKLSAEDKADANNMSTHKMFWGASFFYNLIKPRWDKEGSDVHCWIDGALDAHLADFKGVSRPTFFDAVGGAISRVRSKHETLSRLEARLALLDADDVYAQTNLNDLMVRLRGLTVETFIIGAVTSDLFKEQVHNINLTLFVLEDENMELNPAPPVLQPAPLPPAVRGNARSAQSIIAEVDGASENPNDSVQFAMDDLIAQEGSLFSDGMDVVGMVAGSNMEEEEEAKKKKKSKNQRRKEAKDRQMAELTVVLADLCNKVALETALENERAAVEKERSAIEAARTKERLAVEAAKEKERLAIEAARERERLAIEAANEEVRLAIETAKAKERLAIEAAKAKERAAIEHAKEKERLAIAAAREEVRLAIEAAQEEERLAIEAAKAAECLAIEAARIAEDIQSELLTSVIGEIATEVATEVRTESSSLSQKNVLEQARQGVLPSEVSQELLQIEFPAADNMLQQEIECFICMQSVDFRDPNVRYLVCCGGGSFTCPDCVSTHNPPDRHALQAERQIVVFAASIRRKLKIGEFANEPR